MQELSKDLVALLQYLVPGVLVAWVYYGFTPHAKPSQFERVVQALIFTVIVQVLVKSEKVVLQWLGGFLALGTWTEDSQLVASLFTALVFGVAIAAATRHDWMHDCARRFGLTGRSGYPSEHYGAFAEKTSWIVLQLKDGTRLYGWPKRWPTEGDKGHYLVTNVERSYVDMPGEAAEELNTLEGILVSASDVKLVEFVK